MGVIKRKNIVKGNEGGLKYICDVCSADITSTVSELYPIHPICAYAPTSSRYKSLVLTVPFPGPNTLRPSRLQRL